MLLFNFLLHLHLFVASSLFFTIISLTVILSSDSISLLVHADECPSSQIDPKELKEGLRQFQNKVLAMGIQNVLVSDFVKRPSRLITGLRLGQAAATSSSSSSSVGTSGQAAVAKEGDGNPYPIIVRVHWHMINEVIPDSNIGLQLQKLNSSFGNYFRFVLATVCKKTKSVNTLITLCADDNETSFTYFINKLSHILHHHHQPPTTTETTLERTPLEQCPQHQHNRTRNENSHLPRPKRQSRPTFHLHRPTDTRHQQSRPERRSRDLERLRVPAVAEQAVAGRSPGWACD
jgi:hypothetical protein